MREISTESLKVGEHIIVDGVEYVAKDGTPCDGCDLFNCGYCHVIPCTRGLIIKRVETAKEQEEVGEHDKDTPMTYIQLAEWVSKGNGQCRFRDGDAELSYWVVDKREEDLAVSDSILIRPWGADEWIKPTVEIYERDCKK